MPLACLVCLLAGRARAGQGAAPEVMPFDESSVTANEHEQAREEVTAGVTVVTCEQIRRLGVRSPVRAEASCRR